MYTVGGVATLTVQRTIIVGIAVVSTPCRECIILKNVGVL